MNLHERIFNLDQVYRLVYKYDIYLILNNLFYLGSKNVILSVQHLNDSSLTII